MKSEIILSALALATLAACRSTPKPGPASTSTTSPAPVGQTHPSSAQPGGLIIQGRLLERIDVPNYSYLRLQSDQGEIWAAVPTSTVQKGADLRVTNATAMTDFESTTLKRRFKVIYFGTLGGHPAPNTAPALASGETIPRASGSDSRTIAELFAQKQTLKDRTVTLRGKVVKFNPGILGRNWIHIQDGSGDSSSGTHDIAITTQDMTSLGQVIQVQGTVHLDQDFGSGYRYPVIVEGAKIQP